jgi:hypothetical protein
MRCASITRAGGLCKLEATHGSYCYSHAPETADERRRRARRGGKAGGNGRARSSPELQEVKNLLKDLTDRVIGKEGTEYLWPAAGAVAAQLINARLRTIELERKIREQEELLQRIEQLEELLDKSNHWRRQGRAL